MNTSFSQVIENKENILNDKKSHDSACPRSFGTDLTNALTVRTVLLPNPQHVEYYANDIYDYLFSIESQNRAKSGFLKIQTDINEKMRSILIDWLIDVHLKFKSSPETLFLTINIIDRYLEKIPVNRSRLQLVGLASMLIASKFEDVYVPEVGDLVYVSDKAYDKDEIINMESSVLRVVGYNVCSPSAYRFLERFCALCECEEKQFVLSRYFVELTLPEYSMLKYQRSLIAASAVYLMHKVLKISPEWPELLENSSPYIESDIKPCAKDMCLLAQRAPKSQQQSVRKKFLQPQFFQVANTTLI